LSVSELGMIESPEVPEVVEGI